MAPYLDAWTSPGRGTLGGLILGRDGRRSVGVATKTAVLMWLPTLILYQQFAPASDTASHGSEETARAYHPPSQK